ncbi:hypothetical protein CMI38_02505 [Candidatus Pacearchaeota archaeon]|mgnify:CR=1 FL=1|nr:hypothetical protein [Candidatus Pacearchaeota archaeon]|tara:strand:- start:5770 stop:6240 length:471 start_codon:yes stop_codon:yes gene_type:complete
MLRVLFDTNIYGFITLDKLYGSLLTEKIKQDQDFQVHNFRVIRNELRNAKNMLPLYDRITTNRVITITPFIEEIAIEYFREYKKIGGIQKETNNFMNDLRIVACASFKGFDIIYSDDNNTMCSELAKNSYLKVNIKHKLRTPYFHSYNVLKKSFGL